MGEVRKNQCLHFTRCKSSFNAFVFIKAYIANSNKSTEFSAGIS